MADNVFPLKLSKFPVDVPLLPSIEYDFRGLHDFPTRHGFTSNELRDLDHRPAEVSASFVQSWLFFGLLADLTGTVVDRQSVLHSSAHHFGCGRRPASHLHDPYHPELGIRTSANLKNSEKRKLSRKIRANVQIGVDNVQRIDQLNVANEHPMPLILLSVKMLLCDFAAMRVGRLGVYSAPWDIEQWGPLLLPYQPDSSFISSSAKVLQSMMISKGWCPSQIHRVGSTCDYSMMHYLSNIDRRIPEKMAHISCSSNHCQAYNSDPDTYVTSHTFFDCQCSFIAAPTEQLNKIISSGGVPLISLHEGTHGKLTIRVHTSKAKSQYTAISHVWSGGLGNVHANALPLCQLRYLNHCLSNLPKDGERGLNYKKNAYVRDLSGKVWISPLGLDNLVSTRNSKPRIFWMDTLCIPVDQKSTDLRMKAINKMDAVYAHAREVLVLDSEAQKVSISETHPSELLARLAYSSWMGRSWTLQEGAIGRATYFQCADGAMTLERSRSCYFQQSPFSLVVFACRGAHSVIRHRTTKINYSEAAIAQTVGHERLENVMLKTLLNSLHRGRDTRMSGDSDLVGLVPEDVQLDSFVSVWNELINRSTTKPEDIFAIFGNLLDFNAGQIIKLPQNERMKAILWSSSVIPFSLLYNTGPRLKEGESHRDRWVPTVPKGSTLTNRPSMKFADDGCSFCLSTLENEDPPLAVTAQIGSLPLYCYLLDTKSEKTYFIKAVRSENDALVSVTHQAICIVIEPFVETKRGLVDQSSSKATKKTRGACLFVTSKSLTPRKLATLPLNQTGPSETDAHTHRTTHLSTVYDCPLRIWEVNNTESTPESESSAFESQGRPISCPTIECEVLEPNYELHLETGTYDTPA